MIDTDPSKILKYCPFCGSSAFPWDGKKAHVCKDCKNKLYTNEVGAVIALIENQKHELLFTIRKYNPAKAMLDLPGGFIDIGETAEHATIREIKEELNLEVEKLEFFGTFPNQYIYAGLTYFTIDIAFKCKMKNFDTIQANDDVANIQFLNPTTVNLNNIGLESVRNIVKTWNTNYYF